MTLGGWIFLILSWTVIIGVLVYCMIRTLGNRSNNHTPD